jgi:hypothetical protein
MATLADLVQRIRGPHVEYGKLSNAEILAQAIEEIDRRLTASEGRPVKIESMTVSGPGSVGIKLGGCDGE